jgi:photosystem II stability/assembly factor-like uncharacterized protein
MRPLRFFFVVLIELFTSISYSQSFQKQTIAVDKSISDVHMVTAAVGYAGGVDGVYKTINGGTNWQLLPYFVPSGDWTKDYYPTAFNVVHLHFFNELQGIAYGWHSYNYEMVMATTDGGATWSVKHFFYPQLINYSFNYLNSLHVFDNNSMIIAGNSGRILKTMDGGEHWTGTKIDDEETDLRKIQFTSSTHGYTAGERRFYTSSDAGDHWSMRKLNFELNDFHFFDSQNGVALSTGGYFFQTSDAGKTWTQGLMQFEGDLTHLEFANNLIGYASGYTGLIYKTIDGGKTWLKIYNDGNTISSSFLFTQDAIWFSIEKGYLLYSGNGGAITVPAPSITSVNPTSGKIGNTITINGVNLSSVLGVKFNGVSARFKVSSGSITTEIPRTATTGKIELLTPNGSVFSTTDYVISQEPKLYQPVAATRGTASIIEGENLQFVTKVSLSKVTLEYEVISSQKISFTIPFDYPYANDVLSVVSSFGTASVSVLIVGFPNISNASPGTYGPGQNITLTGEGLALASAVSFGNLPATSFNVISNTEISCIAPDVPDKIVNYAYVQTPAGKVSSVVLFTICPAPEITSISPTTIKIGEELKITGRHLPTVYGRIWFNDYQVSAGNIRYVSDSILFVKVPGVGTNEVLVKIENETRLAASKKTTFSITGEIPYLIGTVTPLRVTTSGSLTIEGHFPPVDSITINGLKHTLIINSPDHIFLQTTQNTTSGIVTLYINGVPLSYPEELIIADEGIPKLDFFPKVVSVGQKVNVVRKDYTYFTILSVSVNGIYIPFDPVPSVETGFDITLTINEGLTSGPIKVTTTSGIYLTTDILEVKPASEVKPAIYSVTHGSTFDNYLAKVIGHNLSTVTNVRMDQFQAEYTIQNDDTLIVKGPKNPSLYMNTQYLILESPAGVTQTWFNTYWYPRQSVVSVSPTTARRGSIVTIKLSAKKPYIDYQSYYNFLFDQTITSKYIQLNDTTFLVEVPLEGDVEGKVGVGSSYSDIDFKLSTEGYCESMGAATIFPLKKVMMQGKIIPVSPAPYVDNTSDPIDVIPGQTLRLGVTPSQVGIVSKIFIDWNADGDFNEPGIMMIDGNTLPPLDTMVYVLVTVPEQTQVNDKVKLRIVSKLYSSDDLLPCGLRNSGQVIDYQLNINAPSNIFSVIDYFPARGTTNTKVTVVGDHLDAIQNIKLNENFLEFNIINETTAEIIIPEDSVDGELIFYTETGAFNTPEKFVMDSTITPPDENLQNFDYTYRVTIKGNDVAFFTTRWSDQVSITPVQEFPESGILCLYTPGGEICLSEPIRYNAQINFPTPFEVRSNEVVILTGSNLSEITSIRLDNSTEIPFTIISNDSLSFVAPESDKSVHSLQITDFSRIQNQEVFYILDDVYCTTSLTWREGFEMTSVKFSQISNSSAKNLTGGYSDYGDQVAILDRYNTYAPKVVVRNYGNFFESVMIGVYISESDKLSDAILTTNIGVSNGFPIHPNGEGVFIPFFSIPDSIASDKKLSLWFVVIHFTFENSCKIAYGEIERYSIIVKKNQLNSDFQITSVNRTEALANDDIEITGTNFDQVKVLQINDLPIPFTVVSPTVIRFTVPSAAETGIIKITSLTGGAESPSVLKIIKHHTVTSITPPYGKPGDVVIINGTNLTEVKTILFDDLQTSDFLVWSSNRIRLVVPSAGKTGPIRLKDNGDYTVNSELFYFCDGITPSQHCKVNQSITFADLPAATFGQSPITLTATASSSLSVSYISSNTSVATVAGNKLTIVGPGTTVITASQSGSSSYNPAPSVQKSLVVNLTSQTITFDALATVTYGQGPITLTASASSGLPVSFISSNTAIASVAGNKITIVDVGSVTITATQPGNNYYNPASSIDRVLIVAKASQTITFNVLEAVTYGQPPFTLTASSSSGLPVSFSSSNTAVASIAGNKVTIVGVGSTTITALQPGNTYYNAAPNIGRTLDVGKISQTITFNAVTGVPYSSLPITLQATASSGLSVVFTSEDEVTLNDNLLTVSTPGRVTVQATQNGNSTYEAAAPVDRSFCIIPVKPTITTIETSPGVYVMTSSSVLNNHWFLGETEIENESTQTLHATKSGTYKVNVQADDCVSEFSEPTTVTITGLENNIGDVLTYPNPVKEKLLIESLKTFTKVLITSATGTILQAIRNDSPGDKLEINLTEFNAGVYILEVYEEDKLVYREKIIKE